MRKLTPRLKRRYFAVQIQKIERSRAEKKAGTDSVKPKRPIGHALRAGFQTAPPAYGIADMHQNVGRG